VETPPRSARGRRPGAAAGTQLSLPLELSAPAGLPELGPWSAMVADYATTTLSAGDHPLGLLRERLARDGAVHSADLHDGEATRDGQEVRVGGLVVARQRPGTAKGVVFLLLEDEHGTINLIVPPPVYERHRLVVRTEPLVLAAGRLERPAAGGGAVNVLVSRLAALEGIGGGGRASVADLPRPTPAAEAGEGPLDEPGRAGLAATGTEDFRPVAPAASSFGRGRRR
jgi:error-prone DNA polymerase